MKACVLGKIDMVKFLFQVKNIDINMQNQDLETVLILVLIKYYKEGRKKVYFDIMQLLLNRTDLDINLANPWGQDFFIIICIWRIEELLKIVIESKNLNIDFDAEDNEDKTGWMHLCQVGDKYLWVLKELVQRKTFDVNLKNCETDETILIWAWKNNHFDLIKILLLKRNKDLDINVQDSKTGNTLLIWAVQCQHLEIIDIIMKNFRENINFDLKNKNNQSAIEIMNFKKRRCDEICDEITRHNKKRKLD
jgi:hypothetical protein